ncbi:MAG: hypothetical protein AAGA88_00655, partial [Pseudomonadota bacterium]
EVFTESHGGAPSRTLEAVSDPRDDVRLLDINADVNLQNSSVAISDRGALDMGFSLAPPGLDRNMIAMQAAQFSTFGVMQATQMGIKLSGDIANAISSFIRSGGTVRLSQTPGSSIPLGAIMGAGVGDNPVGNFSDILPSIDLEVSYEE